MTDYERYVAALMIARGWSRYDVADALGLVPRDEPCPPCVPRSIVTRDERARMYEMHQSGMRVSEICKATGRAYSTVVANIERRERELKEETCADTRATKTRG